VKLPMHVPRRSAGRSGNRTPPRGKGCSRFGNVAIELERGACEPTSTRSAMRQRRRTHVANTDYHEGVPSEEVLIPFSDADRLATELRSTLLTTSIRSLKTHGFFDAYLKHLPQAHHDAVTNAVAGVWLPIDEGVAHYTAIEELALTSVQIAQLGKDVGERVQGSILGLMVRTAKTSGLTPWTGLRNCRLFYERMFQGGAVSLVKLGPKEARIELVRNPLFAIPYFRHGLRVIAMTGIELFCKKAYSYELPKFAGPASFAFRLSWA
jgi:hypothetical protein